MRKYKSTDVSVGCFFDSLNKIQYLAFKDFAIDSIKWLGYWWTLIPHLDLHYISVKIHKHSEITVSTDMEIFKCCCRPILVQLICLIL